MKNTVHNDATSSNLKGKPMTNTIGLHWLQQVTEHVPATDEASVHRAQLRVKTLYIRYWSVPKIKFVFVIHIILAKPVTNTLKLR
jgi:hypothetical protein